MAPESSCECLFDEVVEHFDGIPALARALGIERQAIYQWKKQIPEMRALQIERITRGRFQAHRLNPKVQAPAPAA